MIRRYVSNARPLAELVQALMTPACRRRGIANAALVLDPAEVFGERLGRGARIERIVWPKGSRIEDGEATGATLVVSADAATALAIQHLGPQVIERVNLVIGWPAIATLRVTQARRRRSTPARAPAPPPIAPEEETAAAQRLPPMEHQDLKAALARLGAGVSRRGSARR